MFSWLADRLSSLHPKALDPEWKGPKVWYLSPQTHARQIILHSILPVLVILYYWNKGMDVTPCNAKAPWGPERSLTDIVIAVMVWGVFLIQFAYKWGHRLHFMWQPCHVINFAFCLLSVAPRCDGWYRSVYGITMASIYGPFLAIMSPDTKFYSHILEIQVFYLQHYGILLLPLFWIATGCHEYQNVWDYALLGTAYMTLYHYWFLTPYSIWTEVNINLQVYPEGPVQGKWFKEKIMSLCFVLTTVCAILYPTVGKLLRK